MSNNFYRPSTHRVMILIIQLHHLLLMCVVIGNYIKVESAVRMETEWLVMLTRVI